MAERRQMVLRREAEEQRRRQEEAARQQQPEPQQPRPAQKKKTPTRPQVHPLTAVLHQRQAQAPDGAAARVEGMEVPGMLPVEEERQHLRIQGVELQLTLQDDDDGFECVVRRRSTRTSSKTAAGGGSFAVHNWRR